jgi:polysaccharide export outer membrane protein
MKLFLKLALLLPALLLVPRAGAQFSGPAVAAPTQARPQAQPTSDPAVLKPTLDDRVLAPGDLLTVKIFGTLDFVPSFRIAADGTVQLPLIGVVQVAGLSITHAEDLIATRLKQDGMYKDPQITVQVTESSSQFATVAGDLHAVVPMTGSRKLFEVLAAAGPMPVNASHRITILRPGLAEPIVVDLDTDPTHAGAANITIQPRDTILIARAGVVYMLGAFTKQGAIPLDQNAPLTLMQATSLSGGVGFEGRYEDLRIVRTVGMERRMIQVDIKQVLHGTAPDPVLEPNDIVFLPSNALKAAIKSGGIGTLSSILSLLIIALQSRGT